MQRPGTIAVLAVPSPGTDWLERLPAPFAVRMLPGGADVLAEARTLPPSTVVAADCEGRVPGWTWELLTAFPSAPVVAALDLATAPPGTVGRLLDRGVADVLDLGMDRAADQVAWRFRQACARPFLRRLEGGLTRYTSTHARTILRGAARVAITGGGAAELAGEFGVSTETVAGWCAAAGLLPPRSLQSWLRVLLAAILLEEHGRTVAAVARSCGYATDRGLRRTITRFLGIDVRTLRRQQPFEVVMAAFNAELAAVRGRG
jgi:AraC-like DNA-binding protein